VTPLAHFTPAELPGTLAVLLFGVTLGTAIALRRRDALTLGIVGFFGLAAAGSVLDRFEGVGEGWRTAVDVVFLLGAGVLLATLTRSARGRNRQLKVKDALPADPA
jgi:hypothetical protein